MRRTRGAVKLLLLVGSIAAVVAAIPAAGSAKPSGNPFSPRVGSIGGIVPPLSMATPGVQGSGDLTWHGGPVMHTNKTYAIYWEPTGYAHPFPAGYETTIDQWFTDVAADSGKTTNVYGINAQYGDGSGNAAYSSTFGGSTVATNAFPANGCTDTWPTTKCLSDAQLQTEIATVITAQGWPKNSSTMYFIFTPQDVGSCASFGCAYTSYCAYHGSFNSGGTVIYGNEPFTKGYDCDNLQYPNGSSNAADPTINVASHEHNEAITDWQLNAWYDAAGYEIGDKCAWDFGTVQGPSGSEYNQTINGHHYYMQREYSNTGHACLQQPAGATPATVSSLKPNKLGQGAAKAKVHVNGTNFVSGATVSVSGSGVTVTSVTFLDAFDLTVTLAVAGNAATGARDVSVTNPGAAAGTCTGCLTIDPGPVVTSVVPSVGVHGTSEPVQIIGSNFVNGAKVKFKKGITVTSHTFVNSSEIDATISIASGAKLGGYPVTVTNPDKGVGTKTNAITVT